VLCGIDWHHCRQSLECARLKKSTITELRNVAIKAEKVKKASRRKLCCISLLCCGNTHGYDEDDPLPDRSPDNHTTSETQGKHSITATGTPSEEIVRDGIVVGLLNRRTGVVKERLQQIQGREGLFKAIQKATYRLRPLPLRILSLKTVASFSIYECHPKHSYHTPVEIDSRTEATMASMFADYASVKIDYEDRWHIWVQNNFNNRAGKTSDGHLALQLVLRWFIKKMMAYIAFPIILSLVIGLWYMQKPGDRDSVNQTAWTITSYIITTAGGELNSPMEIV
jgi:hypothetical protein